MIEKIIISILLIMLEALHDSIREKLEVGSYDEKIDYTTKVIKAIGFFSALFWYWYMTHDFAFVIVYIIVRVLLFDLYYYIFSGREISFKYIVKNLWVNRLMKMFRWRNG